MEKRSEVKKMVKEILAEQGPILIAREEGYLIKLSNGARMTIPSNGLTYEEAEKVYVDRLFKNKEFVKRLYNKEFSTANLIEAMACEGHFFIVR